jgi:hypothetical protein
MSGGHGHHIEGSNKYVALLIAVLALFLAFSEMLGKHAEKSSIQSNIEASNLWSFFQAKTIRRSMAQNFTEAMQVDAASSTDDTRKAAIARQIETWTRLAARLESEPDTNEGRRELMARAQAAEKKRDVYSRKHTGFEIASAIFQVAIVVASAMIITGVLMLAYAAGGLGVIAAGVMAVTQFAPAMLPF